VFPCPRVQTCVELLVLLRGVLVPERRRLQICGRGLRRQNCMYSCNALQRADTTEGRIIVGDCGRPEPGQLHNRLAATCVCRGRRRHVVCSFRDRKLGCCADLKDVTLPSGTMVANRAERTDSTVSRAAGVCMHISNAMAGNTMDRPWSRFHQPYASQLSARQPHEPQPHHYYHLLFIPCHSQRLTSAVDAVLIVPQ
jgi:hypothetical protein